MKACAIVLICFCLLGACTYLPIRADEAKTRTHAAQSLTNWHLTGAIAVKNQHRGWTASLEWQQYGTESYLIHLYGPLGSNAIVIEKRGSQIKLVDGPQTLQAKRADELLYQQAGISLPVENLYYWVRGIPIPGRIKASRFDNQHHLVSLTQSGFQIDYANYQLKDGFALPGKIKISGHNLMIKLVIKKWEMPA